MKTEKHAKQPDNPQNNPEQTVPNKEGEGGVMHQSLNNPPHDERNPKTRPIAIDSCQKG